MVAGGWSVTVAGSCPGALPADVEMRLRFPQPHQTHPTQPPYQVTPTDYSIYSCFHFIVTDDHNKIIECRIYRSFL